MTVGGKAFILFCQQNSLMLLCYSVSFHLCLCFEVDGN